MADVTEKAGEVVDTVSDLISSKKEFAVKQTINVLLIFIIMFVFGCFDFLHATFHFEYLLDPNYWVSVTTKTIGDICAFNIGINLLIDDAIKRDRVLAKAKEIYEKLNQYRDKDFDYYVDNIYNRQRKIEAYKNKINFHIRMLNKVSKNRDRALYSSDDPKKQELKKTNKYCIKRANLESVKTDEFIEKNFENLNVRYIAVDPAVFGVELDGSKRVIQNKVTGSIVEGRVKASFTTILSIVGVSMFLSSILLQPNSEEAKEQAINAINWALRAIGDIGIILWQVIRGIFRSKKIVSQQLTIPCNERVNILKGYYAWRQEQGQWVPKCYTDLLKEKATNDEETIEMTREEYNRRFGNEEVR